MLSNVFQPWAEVGRLGRSRQWGNAFPGAEAPDVMRCWWCALQALGALASWLLGASWQDMVYKLEIPWIFTSLFPTNIKNMSSNTQNNTDRPSGTNTASTGNTGKLALIIISRELCLSHLLRQASGLRSTEFGANTERTGYDSSPLTQQQHVCQGTSPFGEEDMEGGVGQKQYGRGQGGIGTGVGHHKSHQEGKFHCFIFEILNLSLLYR